ncbi:LysE family transporter [Desulfolucanica intricata]|uniref:LysE family transporter n=1 Tax=Desulfolucanica intricata TaxID=1285191 RepID=UPI0008371AD9|nr:LysE family transporter [Desulfolucanica intricata]
MDSGTIFTTALMVGFSGAIMPGPLLTVTISQTAIKGFWAGILIVIGHVLLEAALIGTLALGLAEFLKDPGVKTFIALAGGIFLIYLGWDMTRSAYKGDIIEDNQALQLEESERQKTVEAGKGLAGARMHPVLAGILVSLSNPYWLIWWATLGLSYITLAFEQGNIGLISFFSGHILADFLWYGLVSAAVAGSRHFLRPVVYRGIIMVCGLFLLVLGGFFIKTGIFT